MTALLTGLFWVLVAVLAVALAWVLVRPLAESIEHKLARKRARLVEPSTYGDDGGRPALDRTLKPWKAGDMDKGG